MTYKIGDENIIRNTKKGLYKISIVIILIFREVYLEIEVNYEYKVS